MFYMKHKGKKLEIECDNVYNLCPKCGKECVVDLADVVTDSGLDLYGTASYCPECSAEIAKDYHEAEDVAKKISQIAARHKVPLADVEQMVARGAEPGEDIHASIVRTRLALSIISGAQEYFSEEEMASMSGMNTEEFQQMMKERSVEPAKLTTLPGFEWLLV